MGHRDGRQRSPPHGGPPSTGERCHHRPRARYGGARSRRSFRRDQRADRGLRHHRVRQSRSGHRRGSQASGCPVRHHRCAAVLAAVTADVHAALAGAFQAEWGKVVATLIGMTGDWDLAEECAQDAFAQALRVWPRDGIPRRPGAWLTTVARNRALDRLRRGASEAAKLQQAAILAPQENPSGGDVDGETIPDERLRLIFTCCHPALSLEARVALTLRTLAGLTTGEIARAFLTAEQTMAKRLVRAKQKIRNAGIPYRVPPAHLLAERTNGVLNVLYLLFNEGYGATEGAKLIRTGLSAEAIRLARPLVRLLPDETEAAGLLAVM